MTEKYRKKPVEVEVIKFDKNKWSDELNRDKSSATYPMVLLSIIGGFSPVIETLEGDMKVSDGDYIIKGVQGEFYPCKPDIFHETYEPMIDYQPAFAVGEYYVSENKQIYKLTADQRNTKGVWRRGILIDDYLVVSYVTDEELQKDTPATAEQIATFKRAEHFASKGREWSEFRKGDIVQNTKTMQLGLVESVDEDGDAWVNYNIDKPLIYPSCYKCTGALFLNLIQTAEELQEVGE